MTVKRRLVPKLQLKERSVGARTRMVLVTTVGFDRVIEVGEPVSQAKIFQAQAVDELVFLDLDASVDGRGALLDVVRRAAEEVFMPFTVGGGVRTVDDVRALLENGADKVSINTAAVEEPGLVDAAAAQYGSQCVVVSIDYRADGARRRVFTRGGRDATDLDPVLWAKEVERRGAGEILLTSIDRDGSRLGLDIETIRAVADSVGVPVIAAGGCGTAAHFVDGFRDGRADAISSGTYFAFRDENPMQTRSQIRNAGIPIRLHT